MAENNTNQYADARCIEPFNPLDPEVYFDPTYSPPVIADITTNQRDTTNELHNVDYGSDVDPIKIEGVTVPKIQIGGQVILSVMLKKVILDYQYLMPTLYIEVYANKSEITSETYLSVNNVARISFRPSADGKYRRIAWNFYIWKYEKTGGLLKVWCTLKYLPLISLPELCGPIKLDPFVISSINDKVRKDYADEKISDEEFNEAMEASARQLDLDTNIDADNEDFIERRKYNCCQLLAQVAYDLGLGFAASPQCRNDKSTMIAYSSGQPNYLLIQEIVRRLGSTQYIYDAWVDPYGYLVLVNMAHLFKTAIEPEHLVVMGLTGLYNATSNGPHENFVPVRRVITNFNKSNSPSNLTFVNYDISNDFSAIQKNGTDRQYMVVTPEDGSLVPDADTGETSEETAESIPEEVPVTNPEATTSTVDEESTADKDEENSNYTSIETLSGTGDETDEDNLEFKPNNSITSIDIATNPITHSDPGPGANEFRSSASKTQLINMNNSANHIIQEEVSKNYIQNKRASKLVVTMDGVNMGLQRGTWIQVAVFDYSTGQKAKDLHEEHMYPIPGTDKVNFVTEEPDIGEYTKGSLIVNDEVCLPNKKLTDLYYIDGMTFIYTKEAGKIQQILYLIKRSSLPITE